MAAATPATLDGSLYLMTFGVFHTGLMDILPYDAVQKPPTSLTGATASLDPVAAIVADVMAFDRRRSPTQ